jgi:hypothetical protein
MNRLLGTIVTGVAGGIAWTAGMLIFFGPAQAILADPERQSEKFLAVMADPVHPPRMVESFWIVPAGLMVLGFVYAIIFTVIERGIPGKSTTARGLAFGAIVWALAFTWFEFYLPWNVMREPAALVALELLCWLGTMAFVGLAISWTWRLTGGERQQR